MVLIWNMSPVAITNTPPCWWRSTRQIVMYCLGLSTGTHPPVVRRCGTAEHLHVGGGEACWVSGDSLVSFLTPGWCWAPERPGVVRSHSPSRPDRAHRPAVLPSSPMFFAQGT
jgi:hypothetical protein